MTNAATDGDPVHDALAQHHEEFTVGKRLHAVPPHETYAVTVGGRRAVCKLATDPRGDPATEAATMRFVARETPVPVPEILATGPDHFVAEWRDDLPTEPALNDEKAWTMGREMARLHAATGGAFEGYGPVATGGDGALAVDARDDWPAAVRTRLRDRREYLTTVGHEDVADAVQGFLRKHPEVLADAGPPVLCHGNLLPDHAGVTDGEVTCVIDFEHAIVGPPAYDLWRSLIPIGHNEDGDEPAAFRAGYESVRPLPDELDDRELIYHVLLAVEYVESLYLQNQHDPETTRERAAGLREFVGDGLDDLEGRIG